MRYTAKWWRDHAEKPVGTEYWSGVSLNEVENRVREWSEDRRVRRIEVHDDEGKLVAQYPTGFRR